MPRRSSVVVDNQASQKSGPIFYLKEALQKWTDSNSFRLADNQQRNQPTKPDIFTALISFHTRLKRTKSYDSLF